MSGMQDDDLAAAFASARTQLLAQRCEGGYWRGELSSSALATAVAAFALNRVDPEMYREPVMRAVRWLEAHANADGGWGDTPDSPSNLSTTVLAWAALGIGEASGPATAGVLTAAEAWIERAAGGLAPDTLAAAVVNSYGNDRTFSAPILTVCALAGRLGTDSWRFVPSLPFEWSVLPHGVFRFMRLSVVSYAIPALIAIGLVRHRLGPRETAALEWLRDALTGPALRVLRRCQPSHGGFLEAAPLNGFVATSLAAAGWRDHPVTRGCAGFLAATVRSDGSWPIDTDLATWVTIHAVNALAAGSDALPLTAAERTGLRNWLLGQQFRETHRYTHAAPGGWGWTSLPGAVPDADDTAGALHALYRLGGHDAVTRAAAVRGLGWLLDLQNGDGGVPTFCRGWGRLPFDRSCPDITAHALGAFDVWYDRVDARLRRRLDEAMHAAEQYLERAQRADGSWVPLWFGSQRTVGQDNPTYGTAQVVRALSRLTPGRLPKPHVLVLDGTDWLLSAQNEDGGWGGDVGVESSIEETALAVAALAGSGESEAIRRGAQWLVERTHGGVDFEAAPIGLYFARLWYAERLYPLVFTVQALAVARQAE